MQFNNKAQLILEDGSIYEGYSFGYEKGTVGEVVFNTAMVGYPESLTDPSYAGQLMVLTFPLVGNYGVPDRSLEENGLSTFLESEKIHAQAIIISDYSTEFSHWNAKQSLSEWLIEEEIPGIYGIDTRSLTKKLREHGVMMGRIVIDGEPETNVDLDVKKLYENINFVERVSCKEVITYQPTADSINKRVVLVDCGVKHNIIRSLLKRGVEVVRVPWDYDFNTLDFDGLFLSNGPGDPDTCEITVKNIQVALKGKKPICGICMGNQLLAKAGGASIFKLKYGHRSHNQPVIKAGTKQCYITTQNHGYAVDEKTIGKDWEPLFVNMNDGTNEGIKHKTKPFFSAQFHPEACSGPLDTDFIFDDFIDLLKEAK